MFVCVSVFVCSHKYCVQALSCGIKMLRHTLSSSSHVQLVSDSDTSHVYASLTHDPPPSLQQWINYCNTDRSVTYRVSHWREKERKCKRETILAYLASVWWHDEICLYVMFLEEGVPLVAEARFHLVVSIQTLQGGPCDVHLAASTSRAEDTRGVSDKSLALRSQIIIPLIIFIGLIAPSACLKFSTAKTFSSKRLI